MTRTESLTLSAKNVILQVLAGKNSPSYGLEIIVEAKRLTGGAVKLHQGNVYPALRKLEQLKLIASHRGEPLPERGHRPRIYYEITEEGRKHARKWQKSLAKLSQRLEPTQLQPAAVAAS